MLLLIIGTILLILGIILCIKAVQIKINKNKEQELYQQNLIQHNQKLKQQSENLQNKIYVLTQEERNLLNLKIQQENQLNKDFSELQKQKQQELDNYFEKKKQLIQLNLEKTNNEVSKEIENIHKDLFNIRESANKEKQEIQLEIDTLKASLSAGVQARLREQQKKEQLDFYKLSINEADLSDVKMLENLKISFHKPVVLSKLIWTQYFQKQTTNLCDRVLGKKTVCGIYKITNLLTEQCYIGQSVNVAQRWKQHCKCGLGIDASTTNKLYNVMQKDGIWNFTFELLEQCPKELLNEKESFWIQMYQSNIFGYNITKGNKI